MIGAAALMSLLENFCLQPEWFISSVSIYLILCLLFHFLLETENNKADECKRLFSEK